MLASKYLPRERLQDVINILKRDGYQCVGPQVSEGAIVYAPIEQVSELPKGMRDKQAPGQYRLEQQNDQRYFAWANGPQALKPLTFTPREGLWRAEKHSSGQLKFIEHKPESPAIAVLGVRACDLAGMFIQRRHFGREPLADAYYAARSEKLFLIAVHCTHPADTCFCASTGDGPEAAFGYDLGMYEIDDGFIVDARSVSGESVLKQLQLDTAGSGLVGSAKDEVRAAAKNQQRHLPSKNLRQALFSNLNHPRWVDVAERCLSCGNCTAVCPTCFCHRENDMADLDGVASEHYRDWDSCFTQSHSYIHGFNVRGDTRLRYRQWMTHKLGSWHDQYGRSGCVGCGRCITWCPVGIDITEEASAICSGQPGDRT